MPPGGGIAPLVWAARQCRSPKEDEMQRREERGASQRGHQPGDQGHTKDRLQSPAQHTAELSGSLKTSTGPSESLRRPHGRTSHA